MVDKPHGMTIFPVASLLAGFAAHWGAWTAEHFASGERDIFVLPDPFTYVLVWLWRGADGLAPPEEWTEWSGRYEALRLLSDLLTTVNAVRDDQEPPLPPLTEEQVWPGCVISLRGLLTQRELRELIALVRTDVMEMAAWERGDGLSP